MLELKQHSLEKNRRTANKKIMENVTENVSLVKNLVTAVENAVIKKLKVFNVHQGEVTKVFVFWLTELKGKIQAPVTIWVIRNGCLPKELKNII